MSTANEHLRQITINRVPIQWNDSRDSFTFFGIEGIIFWKNPSLLSLLAPLREALGHEFYALLIAHEVSKGTHQDYHAMLNSLGSAFEEGFNNWGNAVSGAGWGKIRLNHIDWNRCTAQVRVERPWELQLFDNPMEKCALPFLDGKLSGIFSWAFKTNCRAQVRIDRSNPEHAYAEFDIAPSSSTLEQELAQLQEQRGLNPEQWLKVSNRYLKEHVTRFLDVIEAEGAFVWEVDRSLRLNFASEHMQRVFEMDAKDLIGTPLAELIESDQRRLLTQSLDASKGEKGGVSCPMRTGSGRRIWVSLSFSPVLDLHGAIIGYRGAGRDITQQRQDAEELQQHRMDLESLLQERESRLEQVINATGVGVWDWYPQTGETQFNERWAQLLGYSLAELAPVSIQTWRDLTHPDDLDKANALIEEIFAGRRDKYECEIRMRHKSGRWVWMYDTGKIVARNDRGAPLRMAGTHMDITELKRTQTQLANDKALLRCLIDSIPDLIFYKDTQGAYMGCNRAFEQFTGLPEAQQTGKTDFMLFAPEAASAFLDADRRMFESGQPRQNEEHLRFPDGSDGLFNTLKSPYYDPDGKLLGLVGVSRDITQSRRNEEERARMQRELQQARKVEALGQLTGGIAHEFNNMLAIILGHAELAQRRIGGGVDDQLRQNLEHVVKAGLRARDLVSQMLAFSRRSEPNTRNIELAGVVREGIELSKATLPSSIHLQTDLDAGLPDVLINPNDIQQVLMNLLINARDAMDGKGELHIGLRRRDAFCAECMACHGHIQGDWLELSIRDTGQGIEQADIERIFDPFFTTKEVGKGTGLGLSIVQSIMEENGGHILLESKPGAGACFYLLFPVLDKAQNFQETAASSASATEEGSARLQGRVLLVDDEPALTSFISQALRAHGLQVTVEHDSLRALDRLLQTTQAPFDLLITDQSMPHLTGLELIARTRGIQADMAVMLYTGRGDAIDAADAGKLGIDKFLLKPLDTATLLEAVQQLLSPSRRDAE
jgi:PAS domain S-box-containing protein